MAHDASFLAKCEQFLLHPTVRALSLAQRVDFLENKGLSPEEITSCLKNIERQNGLSRMVTGSASTTATRAAAAGAAAGASGALHTRDGASTLTMWTLLKKYGLATAASLLLAYAFVQFRQKMILRILTEQRDAALKRKQVRFSKVVEMLAAVSEQRKVYDQVVARVQTRITRVQLLKAAHSIDFDPVAREQQKRREQELRLLQEQVAALKPIVLDAHKASMEQQAKQQQAKQSEETATLQSVVAMPPSPVALHSAPPPRMPHPDLATPEEMEDEKPAIPQKALALA